MQDSFPAERNAEKVYKNFEKFPSYGYWSYSFTVQPLNLNVEGSKFAISPQTPSKFTLKNCWGISQDVLVEVQSAMFTIVAPRRSKGITTQDFHHLKRSESMTFEIAFRDLNNVSLDNFNNVNLTNAEGYITITQTYNLFTPRENDSDEAWRIGGNKNKKKLIRMFRKIHTTTDEDGTSREISEHNYWKENLSAETETEDVKRVKKMFAAALLKKFQMAQAEEDKKDRAKKKMYTSPEELQKIEDEKKAKKEAEQAKKEAEEKEDAQKERDEAMKKWVDEKNKKKRKKKCVIL